MLFSLMQTRTLKRGMPGRSELLLLLSMAILFNHCGRPARMRQLEAIVQDVKMTYAPDARVDLFQADLSRRGNGIVVSEMVSSERFRLVLLDSLRQAAGDLELIDSILVLPAEGLQPDIYAIVAVSVANMRWRPASSAELVSQTLLGTVLKLYLTENGYVYARDRDRYLGWISEAFLAPVDSTRAAQWLGSPRVVCTANYGVVRDRDSREGAILVDLVPGATLKKTGQQDGWIQVETPRGQTGFVESQLVMDKADLDGIRATGSRIVQVARSYSGIPYLWGGTSTKGFDCSGLVQNVFRMNNVPLPRDASQMVLEGDPVEPGPAFENVQVGDLLFFGPAPEKTTHVAIYLGDQHFIHACGAEYGSVHINSLNPHHEAYSAYRRSIFQSVRRIPFHIQEEIP